MPLNQLTGTGRNIMSTIGEASLVDLIPPSFVSIIIWGRDTIPRGLGFASRTGHLTGVIALTIVMIVASATLLTYVAAVYFLIAFPIALLRLIPAVETRWPWDEGSWPLWTVKSTGFAG